MRVFGLASWRTPSQYAIQAPFELGQETFTAQWPPRAFVELQLLGAKRLHRVREELVPIAGKLQQRPDVSQSVILASEIGRCATPPVLLGATHPPTTPLTWKEDPLCQEIAQLATQTCQQVDPRYTDRFLAQQEATQDLLDTKL